MSEQDERRERGYPPQNGPGRGYVRTEHSRHGEYGRTMQYGQGSPYGQGGGYGQGSGYSGYGQGGYQSGSYGQSDFRGGRGGYGNYGPQGYAGGPGSGQAQQDQRYEAGESFGPRRGPLADPRDYRGQAQFRSDYGMGREPWREGQARWDTERNSGRGWGWDQPRRGDQRGQYGRGPKGYKRSDDRISEDIHDRLHNDGYIDSREVTISVQDGRVTLSGVVSDRQTKHAIENLVDSVHGVRDIDNEIRVERNGTRPESL